VTLRSYRDQVPLLGAGVFVDQTALVVGAVELADDVSIWPFTVVRGDVHRIRIGGASNVQDGCVLHVTQRSRFNPDGHPLVVGAGVTVGHRAVLHGCTIGDLCLIGSGAIVLDGAVLEDRVMLGAGSLVPPGRRLQGGHLYVGSPARPARPLKELELALLEFSRDGYVRLKNDYLGSR